MHVYGIIATRHNLIDKVVKSMETTVLLLRGGAIRTSQF